MEVTAALKSQSNYIDRICASIVTKLLDRLQFAHIDLHDNGQHSSFGDTNSDLSVSITVHNPGFYRRIVTGGSIEASLSYIDADWSCSDLSALMQIFVRNEKVLDQLESRFAWLTALKHKLFHRSNSNSVKGSKKNILAHYDLGNDLYASFLDPRMQYSSAVFPSKTMSLEDAQYAKLEKICQQLQLKPGEHLLEIGSGWGGLAIHAAKHYGVQVTTTTISEAQHQWANAEISAQGLQEQITLLKKDYRELEGEYDKLVSIEMIEAVGFEHLDQFFKVCQRHLKPNGLMFLQSITINDQRFDSYRKSVDFIQRYIFPGGCLPSISVLCQQYAKNTDMVVQSIDDIGQDYALTLEHWQQRFNAKQSELQNHGFDQRFSRLWNFYFSYCIGGFKERAISTVHILAAKPDYRA
ncbi:class I SAM-dependent methyltransferase [Alginatibacterium sediminis]|uniref:Class I SAM-dependent methyltransferase n=1 Tax=Alginatibacterium sediminis TaxID=2164068 RepID=A0A420E9F2_9ALTE|nr:cyclopropane-fatty-acyl-phospholipid synthase family protein [Alginatibacterium sediminis]RKF15712.1 class I SAM-dependent methyltransferase [Alginatibacterium sediminis]